MTEEKQDAKEKEFDEWLDRYINAWSAELAIEMHAEASGETETDKAKE
jgi:hypothetical protein